MRRDEPLPADWRTNAERPVMSRGTRIELAAALLVIVAFFELKPALVRWIDAQAEAVQMSALGRCRPPTEFEQLHVVVLNRAGALVAGDCLYVSGPGGYR